MSDVDVRALALALQAPGMNGRRGLPAILLGPPGIGKSARVVGIAKALGMAPVEVVLGSIREPSDFAGLPVQVEDHVRLAPPSWAVRLTRAGQGLLFLDELSCSAPATQAALLRVILDRYVGDLELPSEVTVLAAANPADQAAGGWDVAPALANRLIWLPWAPPSAGEWGAWLMGTSQNLGRIPRLEPRAWEESWALLKPLAASFLTKRPELLLKVPEGEEQRAGAWPSPRSWEVGLRGLAAGHATHDEEAGVVLLAGAIGEGAAGEYISWVREVDLPDPRDLLSGAVAFKPEPSRPDRTRAILLSAVALAAREQKFVPAAWRMLDVACKASLPDLVVAAARVLLPSDNSIPRPSEAGPVLVAIGVALGGIK